MPKTPPKPKAPKLTLELLLEDIHQLRDCILRDRKRIAALEAGETYEGEPDPNDPDNDGDIDLASDPPEGSGGGG